MEAGLHPTPVIDRSYFLSVYFREPTGFMIDEPIDRLGEALMLPRQLEPMRAELAATLPHIHLSVPAPR